MTADAAGDRFAKGSSSKGSDGGEFRDVAPSKSDAGVVTME